MKNETKKKVIMGLSVTAIVTGGMTMGWYLNLFTQSKIPYSYRTGSLILDTLAAIGIRNYNP